MIYAIVKKYATSEGTEKNQGGKRARGQLKKCDV